MINIALQIICSFLVSVALLFIVIELRSKYDRSFLYFGISLILLCALASIDLWIIPTKKNLQDIIFWYRIYHITATCFCAFFVWYLMLLTQYYNTKILKIFIMISGLLSMLLLTDLMIKAEKDKMIFTILYDIFFAPFMLLTVTAILFIIIKKLKRTQRGERKIYWFHLIGLFLLCLGGVLDTLTAVFIGVFKLSIPNFSIMGCFAFGIMASLVFTERFLMILKDREKTYKSLENAYKEMEEVNALKQIGESTAIINHEIKNYMCMISGTAQLLEKKENLTDYGRQKVKSIIQSVNRLTNFSEEILDLSKSQIIKDKTPIDISQLIVNCVEKHFANYKSNIVLKGVGKEHLIYGDWSKLEQIFVNLIKNSIDAVSEEVLDISLKIVSKNRMLLVIIEDNGTGCDKPQLDNMFKAFYTTKKGRQGTGLGLSITRTIIESHGGRISAYSKNLERKEKHGLTMQIAFPKYDIDKEATKDLKDPIILIKEGMENIQSIIRIFQNVHVNPYIVQDVVELKDKSLILDNIKILGTTENINTFKNKITEKGKLFLMSYYKDIHYVLECGTENGPQIFSEEYVLSLLS